jgi:RsiW-degrading membrane proteinase PrsW (M82 family)
MSDHVPSVAPRKWLGPKGGWIILAVMLVVWLGHLLFDQYVVGNLELTPNTLVLGGFAMTAAIIYTMAYRLRPDDGVTPLRLLVTFLVGGLVATELAFIFEDVVIHLPVGSPANQSILTHALAGIIEEACKLAVVVVAARGLKVRTARSGLFMGGAVGLGFAAFEDMRYAFESISGLSGNGRLTAVLETTLVRDAIGPLEHPIMSALLAAALFAATRNGRFRITPTVIAVYVVISAVHGLIDSVPAIIDEALDRDGIPLGAAALGFAADLVLAVALGVVWLVYTRRLRARTLATALADDAVAPPVESAQGEPVKVRSVSVEKPRVKKHPPPA